MTAHLPSLLKCILNTVLPLAALWLLFRVALRAERCYGYNRLLLLAAPVLAVLLPLLPRPELLAAWAPNGTENSGVAGVSVLLPTLSAAGGGGAGRWSDWPWLAGLYLAGVALGLGRLAYRIWQLHCRTRELPREIYPGYKLAFTGGQLPTSSFGTTVFWDNTAQLTQAEADSVLAHELAHVRQGHTYDLLWLEIWRAVLWPNPFAHLLLPALRLTHELLADREAADALSDLTSAKPAFDKYAALLAQLSVRRHIGLAPSSLLQPFTFSFTLTRLTMLQNQTPVRRWKQLLALPVLAGLLVVTGRSANAQTVPAVPSPPKMREEITTVDLEPGKPKIYTYADQMPELPGGGGLPALLKAIQANMVYPKANSSAPMEGRVFVSFVVEADGAADDIKVVKGLGPAYDATVVAAIQQLPRLAPGRQDGKPVAVSLTVPVQFMKMPK